MPWTVPCVLQLIRCAVDIKHMPFPLISLYPAVRLCVHAGCCAVEGIQCGDIRKRIISDLTRVEATRSPMIARAWRLRTTGLSRTFRLANAYQISLPYVILEVKSRRPFSRGNEHGVESIRAVKPIGLETARLTTREWVRVRIRTYFRDVISWITVKFLLSTTSRCHSTLKKS